MNEEIAKYQEVISHFASEWQGDNPNHYIHDWIRALKAEYKWVLNSVVSRQKCQLEDSRKNNESLFKEIVSCSRRHGELQSSVTTLSEQLRLEQARLDYVLQNCSAKITDSGIELLILIPFKSTCIRTSIDSAIGLK
jgi:hypothetical protein